MVHWDVFPFHPEHLQVVRQWRARFPGAGPSMFSPPSAFARWFLWCSSGAAFTLTGYLQLTALPLSPLSFIFSGWSMPHAFLPQHQTLAVLRTRELELLVLVPSSSTHLQGWGVDHSLWLKDGVWDGGDQMSPGCPPSMVLLADAFDLGALVTSDTTSSSSCLRLRTTDCVDLHMGSMVWDLFTTYWSHMSQVDMLMCSFTEVILPTSGLEW